jgi:hypothetical protein
MMLLNSERATNMCRRGWKNAKLNSVRIPVIVGAFFLLLLGTSTAWANPIHDQKSGSINGLTWQGRTTLGWGAPGLGEFNYYGTGTTQTSAPTYGAGNYVWVLNRGIVLCGPQENTDWYETGYAAQGWVVGRSGFGGPHSLGMCWWWLLNPNPIVDVRSTHDIYYNGQVIAGTNRAKQLP